MQVHKFQGKTIYQFGRTFVYKEDLVAVLAIIAVFLTGALMVAVGKYMEVVVEAQHKAEQLEIAKDELVNYKVTH